MRHSFKEFFDVLVRFSELAIGLSVLKWSLISKPFS